MFAAHFIERHETSFPPINKTWSCKNLNMA